MSRRLSIVAAAGVALCLLVPCPVVALETVVLDDTRGHYPLGREIELLEDRDRRWTVKQVRSAVIAGRFVKSGQDLPNFGITDSAHWVRVSLRNESTQTTRWYLIYRYSHIDRIDLFGFDEAGRRVVERHLSGLVSFSRREVPHRHFLVPLQIAPKETLTLYLRFETSGGLIIPLSLLSPSALAGESYRDQLANGLLYGATLLIVFYNFFLFISLRDRSYLYLVLYVLGLGLFGANDEGLAFQYLWPTIPWWNNISHPIFLTLAPLFSLAYARCFLSMRAQTPRLDKIAAVLMVITGASAVATLLLGYRAGLLLGIAALFPIAATNFIAGVLCWRQGFRAARFYLLAWSAVLVTALLTALYGVGVIQHPFFNAGALKIGMMLQFVLLSVALADRINIIKREKEQAQAQALQVQRQAAERLEEEVESKTLDLQQRTREVEEAYRQLSEHDRLKSNFFANVSHELRTPLTLILTPLARLLEDPGGDLTRAVADRLRSMRGSAQRLLRLVNQLLDFARIESGAATVAYELLDLRAIAEPIVKGFDPFARSKGLTLELRGPDELPRVYWDANNMDKVLTNLLSNACKFTEAGGMVVLRLAHEERGVTIAVKDTGIGIERDELPRVFERFHQVDSGVSRKYEGTGIGLALCKELVELTGGSLEVESEPGLGTTFTVVLPLGQDHIKDPKTIRSASITETDDDVGPRAVGPAVEGSAAALAAELEARVADSREQPDRHPADDTRPLLLVVEDNPGMRSLVAEICAEEFSVLEAADGEQGLEMIHEHHPALVVSDIMMPRIDGYQLLREVRADPTTASIPVMLVTAKVGPDLRLEGLEIGADDYITKPFEPRELLARARNLVRLQAQERALRELNASLQEEVVQQSAKLERARMLGRYLSPAVVHAVLEEGQRVQVSQQRQRLTVFRLQLRGFDQLTEVVEPEEMAAMLNGFLSAMMDVAFSHGATIDTVVQDMVGGFFGAPTSEGQEKDAVRCAEMAGEMWRRAVEVSQRWRTLLAGPPPAPTMVLCSGYATVGNFGSVNRLEYTAMGGPASLASALLPKVRPGMLACGKSTWALIKAEVAGELYESVELAGLRSRPVELYQLATPVELDVTVTPLPVGPSEETEAATPAAAGKPIATPGTDELATGAIFAVRYEVVGRLGSGGMGVVYRVRDLKLGIDVAVKLMRRDLRADPAGLKRLYREVRLARLVSHPNVARIYDLGDWEGHEFISMEFIDGHSLGYRLETGGSMDLDEGLDLLRQLCSGLAAAHLAGIVHRDLKPSNIMLEPGGRVVILDFGIARWLSTRHPSETETKRISGTPLYMAPEQFTGEQVDQRADIYSLGVVTYEIFTGRPPFLADRAIALAYKHSREPPPHPLTVRPDLPPRLAALIMRCLEKEPKNRFNSVGELLSLITGGIEDDTLVVNVERVTSPKEAPPKAP